MLRCCSSGINIFDMMVVFAFVLLVLHFVLALFLCPCCVGSYFVASVMLVVLLLLMAFVALVLLLN